jgi:hypothetical protein
LYIGCRAGRSRLTEGAAWGEGRRDWLLHRRPLAECEDPSPHAYARGPKDPNMLRTRTRTRTRKDNTRARAHTHTHTQTYTHIQARTHSEQLFPFAPAQPLLQPRNLTLSGTHRAGNHTHGVRGEAACEGTAVAAARLAPRTEYSPPAALAAHRRTDGRPCTLLLQMVRWRRRRRCWRLGQT